jgi:hypothetical protein
MAVVGNGCAVTEFLVTEIPDRIPNSAYGINRSPALGIPERNNEKRHPTQGQDNDKLLPPGKSNFGATHPRQSTTDYDTKSKKDEQILRGDPRGTKKPRYLHLSSASLLFLLSADLLEPIAYK